MNIWILLNKHQIMGVFSTKERAQLAKGVYQHCQGLGYFNIIETEMDYIDKDDYAYYLYQDEHTTKRNHHHN